MNIVEKEKWISKTVRLPVCASHGDIEKIAALKEFLRINELHLLVNPHGQIEIRNGSVTVGTTGPVFGGS